MAEIEPPLRTSLTYIQITLHPFYDTPRFVFIILYNVLDLGSKETRSNTLLVFYTYT